MILRNVMRLQILTLTVSGCYLGPKGRVLTPLGTIIKDVGEYRGP